jgi:2-methylcitrate dehydratase PrpD
MSALTAELGRFASSLRFNDIPDEALAVAKTGFTDCFGVMIAGARDRVVALLDREMAGSDSKAQASLIPSLKKRNVEDAALVNGAAAHVLDYDDVTFDGHPSAVLVPAIIAQGETVGASGAELLAAYVAGYEVWAELLVREPVPLHQKGWHPTAVRGTVAAAAACAKLRRLSPEQTQTALAIAASMAGGLVANFGSLTKCFQVGRAAQSGVIAARLADAGLTASPDALEHQSGYLAAYSPNGQAKLAESFDPHHKLWHLARQGRNHRPKNAFEAKFSMEFAMASSLIARSVGLAQLTDAFVGQPDVQRLIPRVAIETTKETMNGSAFAPSETVAIRTQKGDVFASEPIVHAKGSMQRPLSRGELQVKFDDCIGDDLGAKARTSAFDRLMNLERLNGAADLLSLQ